MSVKTFICEYCGKRFTNPHKYVGHISAHKRGFLGGTKIRKETHRRTGSSANSVTDLIDRIVDDPRIIGDVAAGISRLLDALGLKERAKKKAPSPEAELERRIGRTVLNAVVRQAAKQITKQLEPAIRAQAELAVVAPELERTVLEEGRSEIASKIRIEETRPTVIEHYIPEEWIVEAFG